MPKAKEREIGFEESMSALEKIVAQLESGELPLERALELFEEGVGLARRCQSQLEEAERKVELLLRERGEIKAVPFETARDAPANDASGPAQLSAAAPRAAGIAGMDLDDEDQEDDINDSIPF
jgi:exodeoxyribonuclease VII small subunit